MSQNKQVKLALNEAIESIDKGQTCRFERVTTEIEELLIQSIIFRKFDALRDIQTGTRAILENKKKELTMLLSSQKFKEHEINRWKGFWRLAEMGIKYLMLAIEDSNNTHFLYCPNCHRGCRKEKIFYPHQTYHTCANCQITWIYNPQKKEYIPLKFVVYVNNNWKKW